jgi:hypothetical protein
MTTLPPVPQHMLDKVTIAESGTLYHRDVYGDWHRLMYNNANDKYTWFSLGGGSVVPSLLERIYDLERRSEFEVNT